MVEESSLYFEMAQANHTSWQLCYCFSGLWFISPTPAHFTIHYAVCHKLKHAAANSHHRKNVSHFDDTYSYVHFDLLCMNFPSLLCRVDAVYKDRNV